MNIRESVRINRQKTIKRFFGCCCDHQREDPLISKAKKDRFAAKVQKEAMQFYRWMMMLSSYVLLNHTGFSKILKKYDKTAGSATRAPFMKLVEAKPFYKSVELKELIAQTEV